MAHSRSEGARKPEAGERDLGTMSSELPLPHSVGTHLYVSLAGFTYVSGRLEHLATPRAILRGHIESQLGCFIIDDGILATITARGLARSVCSPTLRGAPLWAGTLTQVMLFSGWRHIGPPQADGGRLQGNVQGGKEKLVQHWQRSFEG